jgi:Cu(I)/Ag(I) efflux system membrane fusion protein
MPDNNTPRRQQPTYDEPPPDEGGLRAPAHLGFWGKAWWWFHFLILVKLARLRFIAILVLLGAVIVKWDTILAYYDKWTRSEATEHAASSDTEYYCPMHPTVIRDNPKEKCPICFMGLTKRKKGEAKEVALPPGIVNRVQLSPYRIVLAGIQTWKVAYLPLSKEITTVGYVEFDETKVKQVAARVKGRLDELVVNKHGQMVHAGDVLASLYSPDLVVTVQNLLDAHRNKNTELLRDARNRLQLWAISDDQIEEILKTGKANTHLKIRTPIHGHIIQKYVEEGQYVEEGTPLYRVADLSTVWIEAQVYEYDLPFLPSVKEIEKRINELPVTATIPGLPSQTFKGKLTFIYPHVNQESRTVIARFELDNPEHDLRPGMTATVQLKVSPKNVALLSRTKAKGTKEHDLLQNGLVLAVPSGAVIDTGSQKIVYREVTAGVPGEYEGVDVKLGPRMVGSEGASYFPVLQGLEAGDMIVTAGSFLVDAETRLNPAAGSIYFAGSSGSKGGQASVSHVKPSTPEDDEAKVKAAFAKLSSDDDRRLAAAQYSCPVLKDSRLGLMGPPVKILVQGQPVFLCCESCRMGALADPRKTLDEVDKLKKAKAQGK